MICHLWSVSDIADNSLVLHCINETCKAIERKVQTTYMSIVQKLIHIFLIDFWTFDIIEVYGIQFDVPNALSAKMRNWLQHYN